MKKLLLIALFSAIPFLGKAQFAPYCGPLAFTTVEPITLVKFADINKTSSEVIGGTPAHENNIAVKGHVSTGVSYQITLKGNTNGPFTNRFVVFIDWNQNGNFNDDEAIPITQTITNSTGIDEIQAIETITVPEGIPVGDTRMRVKKIFGNTDYLNPCSGTSFGQAEEYTLNVIYNPFAPNCGPLLFPTVEPITLVNFAGTTKITSEVVNGTPAHENFLNSSLINVARGGTYPITLKGNTNGPFTNRFVVFIDWNQNRNFDDANEVIPITQTIVGSTGTDAIQAVQNIVIPATATLGNTAMRIKKTYLGPFLDPCLAGSSFGQAEEYRLNITALAVSDATKSQVKVYPNPVVDLLNIEAASKVSNVQVFDFSGKLVSTYSLNQVKNQVNLNKLAPGVYVVNIQTEKGIESVKIVKK